MTGAAAQRLAQPQQDEPGDDREENDVDDLESFAHHLISQVLLAS